MIVSLSTNSIVYDILKTQYIVYLKPLYTILPQYIVFVTGKLDLKKPALKKAS